MGTRMELPDGRVFAHAKMGGTTGVAGNLYTTMAEADAGLKYERATIAAAVDATSITLTLAGTATVADTYADGFIFVNDSAAGGDGQGEVYKIKSSASAAAGSACIFTLADGDTVKTAIKAGSSVAGVARNEFSGVIIYAAGTITGGLAGIAPIAATADYYFWVQRKGVCNAYTSDTIGAACDAAIPGLTQGALRQMTGTTVVINQVGTWMFPAATASDYCLVNLELD